MSRHTIHVISHTHWDREWYMPFERHRRRLVTLFDNLLDLMDADPDFRHFHADGQIIPLDDYLEIRPQALPRAYKRPLPRAPIDRSLVCAAGRVSDQRRSKRA